MDGRTYVLKASTLAYVPRSSEREVQAGPEGLKVVMVGVAVAHGIIAARGRTALARSLALGSLGLSLAIVLLATAPVP